MNTVKGYRHRKSKSVANKDVDFYSQGVFSKSEELERVNLYAKPGTPAAERQPDPWAVSFPTSRYRSRRP